MIPPPPSSLTSSITLPTYTTPSQVCALVDLVDEEDDLHVNPEARDAYHGGAVVVELGGTFGELGLLVKVVSTKFNVVAVTVVREPFVGSFNVAPETETKGRERTKDDGRKQDKQSQQTC